MGRSTSGFLMLESWTLPRAGIVKKSNGILVHLPSVSHLMPLELLSRYCCQLTGPVARTMLSSRRWKRVT